MSQYSADLPDEFFDDLVTMAARIRTDPKHLAQVWISESNLKPDAICKIGGKPFAAGIFQAVATTLRGLKYIGDPGSFATLTAAQQLVFAEAYYKPFAGRMPNPTAVYIVNFLPALIGQAANPGYPIASKTGGGVTWTSPARAAVIFSQNAGLDRDGDGILEMHDLTVRLLQANTTPRAHEVADRIDAAIARGGTPGPRSSSPPPDDEPPPDYAA